MGRPAKQGGRKLRCPSTWGSGPSKGTDHPGESPARNSPSVPTCHNIIGTAGLVDTTRGHPVKEASSSTCPYCVQRIRSNPRHHIIYTLLGFPSPVFEPVCALLVYTGRPHTRSSQPLGNLSRVPSWKKK
eukprot:1189103-Prorocentrum_minimum.AAC.1